jgi:hypothetical protein
MGLDMGILVKKPQMDMFARPITVALGSASGAVFPGRGIFHRDNDDFFAEDSSIVTDHRVSIDVLDSEWAILPRQGDVVTIPADGTVPAEGTFTVMSAHGDGGGMTNLILQEYLTTVPGPPAAPPRERGKLTPLIRKRDEF